MASSKSEIEKLGFAGLPALAPDLGHEIVTILVGSERKKFTVHKRLLCASATMFRGAFSGQFLESQEGTMTLEEDSPAVFALYVEWLYRSSVSVISTDPHAHLRDLYGLYFFADKLLLPALKDKTMDAIQDVSLKHGILQSICTPEMIQKVWANTSASENREERGLRAFVIHAATYVLVKRAEVDPDDEADSEDDLYEKMEVRKQLVCPNKADLQWMWELSKGSFEIYRQFIYRIDWKSSLIGDPRKRYHNNPRSVHRFHCSKKGFNAEQQEDMRLSRRLAAATLSQGTEQG
ncbi:uncharacterized protein LY89DRAFT_680761 [Mollisia scopiformis]|uniref:BTB domain-containing protein n=1 Tax=Mollisia scopiformis TaxID=149040 RepID=A0A194XR53_MOLSC|nr:uncharacterized protein LY89DRAFT_680761 [Mollisia scopiformis]KUJ22631.1 hypothetical protein LY89DRAFT_680761 [Mollisia scopiformis]